MRGRRLSRSSPPQGRSEPGGHIGPGCFPSADKHPKPRNVVGDNRIGRLAQFEPPSSLEESEGNGRPRRRKVADFANRECYSLSRRGDTYSARRSREISKLGVWDLKGVLQDAGLAIFEGWAAADAELEKNCAGSALKTSAALYAVPTSETGPMSQVSTYE